MLPIPGTGRTWAGCVGINLALDVSGDMSRLLRLLAVSDALPSARVCTELSELTRTSEALSAYGAKCWEVES